jgi:predicted ester cyclase
MPDYTHTIEDIVAKGDKVVVRLTNRGTDKASGKKIEFPVILMSKIADGKVSETWAMVDFLGQAQQLGFELKVKEGEK